MCIALAGAHGNRVEALACRLGRPDRKHHRVAWVRAVRWRCRPGLAVNMDQIGMYFNKVLISIVSLSGILTWTPPNDPFVAMYRQWLASCRPAQRSSLCAACMVRLIRWCGLSVDIWILFAWFGGSAAYTPARLIVRKLRYMYIFVLCVPILPTALHVYMYMMYSSLMCRTWDVHTR